LLIVTGRTGARGSTQRTGPTAVQVDLVGEGQEVGAVGAQAVQHDDAGGTRSPRATSIVCSGLVRGHQ
jgi:hypothetical protein